MARSRALQELVGALGLVVALTSACTSSTALSTQERESLNRFRTVDRAVVRSAMRIVHDYDARLIDWSTAHDEVEQQVLEPWDQMRFRVEGAKFGNKELETTLRRYLAQRAAEWMSLSTAFSPTAFTPDRDEHTHMAAFRVQDEIAERTRRVLEAVIEKLPITELPPSSDGSGVFQPPLSAEPGAAFMLSGDRLVMLDDTGFRVIATGVTWFDVGGGIVWGCGRERVVRWDGKTATVTETKLVTPVCAAGPDGKLWMVSKDPNDVRKDQLASFDGTTWSRVTAPLGDFMIYNTQLIADGSGRLYARLSISGGSLIVVFDKSAWRELRRSTNDVDHMFRGGDGNIWLVGRIPYRPGYPNAVSQLTPVEEDPVFIGGSYSNLWAVVDAKHVATVFDLQRHTIVQGTQQRRLPAPVVRSDAKMPGAFAYDAAGRLWFDLADGLNVIEPDGQRHVFPPGSVTGLWEPISHFVVVGAGPKLPAAQPAVTRTITGTLVDHETPLANVTLLMCALGDPAYTPPCLPGSPQWTATTDAAGHFKFENVPRFTTRLLARLPAPSDYWSVVIGLDWHPTPTCCGDDATELGAISPP